MAAPDQEAPRRLSSLTSSQVGEIAGSGGVAVLPLGATEQHGPHLPCATDTELVEAILDAALERLPPEMPVWALPALAYGASSEHLGFPGTFSLSSSVFLGLVRELGVSAARSGFRKLVLLNGHGGQVHLLEVAARDLRSETGLHVFPIFAYRGGLPAGVAVPADPPDMHAGLAETSLMLAVDPGSVRADRAGPGGARIAGSYAGMSRLSLEGPFPTAWLTRDVSESGVVGDPTGASAELGQRLLDHLAAELALVLTDVCRFELDAE